MADRIIDTTWVGTTTDASKATNWSQGVPDDHSLPASADQTQTSILFDKSSSVDAATGFGFIRAIAVLTGTANFADTETVAMDGKTYIFQTVLTDVDGNVLIGASLTASLLNLFNAINLTGTSGTDYAASMTLHATVTALNSDATQILVAIKDAGTGGNGKLTAEGAGNATWDGNFAGGSNTPEATVRREMYVDDYAGSIMSAGAPSEIQTLDLIYIIGTGAGTVFINPESTDRVVVNSPNYTKALVMDNRNGQGVTLLEIVRGRVELTLQTTGGSPTIIVSDPRAQSENLLITGKPSVAITRQLIIGPGIVTNNGPDWVDVLVVGGQFINKAGVITTLRSTGLVTQETTDTMTAAYIQGGEFDLTVGSGGKTVTDIFLGPLATLFSRRDIDTFILHEIGRK